MTKVGRKRKSNHGSVVAFAAANPGMRQSEIATRFGITQSRVSDILRAAGMKGVHRGRPLKPQAGQTTEAQQWENILHDACLGMDRGARIRGSRILYGYDHRKESFEDSSATSNRDF